MAEGKEEAYKCFRCGSDIEPRDVEVPDGVGVCPDCHETGVMSFTTCIDILNEVFLRDPSILIRITKEYVE